MEELLTNIIAIITLISFISSIIIYNAYKHDKYIKKCELLKNEIVAYKIILENITDIQKKIINDVLIKKYHTSKRELDKNFVEGDTFISMTLLNENDINDFKTSFIEKGINENNIKIEYLYSNYENI